MPHIALIGENSLFKSIGDVFHPLFELFGLILAGIYAVVPNYAVAIIGLTVVIMLALTPITVKSTKSMLAMQRLQPEMKKLQAKYKGAENREVLNQELMKLYKENGTSPFGACMPMLLQTPFLIVLYSLIRGLSYTVKVHGITKAEPRYIPVHSQMHQNLVASVGQMKVWGLDLSSTIFSHHSAVQVIPYLVLMGVAIFLQYYQMKQMNSRNPQAAAANPQMQQMQKFFPLIFAVIYLRVPAGAIIYMLISSAMRIGTQEVLFRTGMVTPVGVEREIGGGPKPTDKESTPPKAIGDGPAKTSPRNVQPAKGKSGGNDGNTGEQRAAGPTEGKPVANGRSGSNGRGALNGRRPAAGKNTTNGKTARSGPPEPEVVPAQKVHPRSRSKRTRKSR